MQLLNILIAKMSFKANLEGHFLFIMPTVFYLENIVEISVNFPIRENLVAKSTKVARLGKFK